MSSKAEQPYALGRDVYDLAQLAVRPIDERLVRRLWVLKVWGDVVDDGRGDGPLDPADVLAERREQDFAPESIGKLTQPVDLVGWERRVRQRFTFLVDLDDDERRWAACDPRHRREIEAALGAGGIPRTDQDELVACNRRLTPPPVLRPRRTARSWLRSSVRDRMMRCASTSC